MKHWRELCEKHPNAAKYRLAAWAIADKDITVRTLQLWDRRFDLEGKDGLRDRYSVCCKDPQTMFLAMARDAVMVCAWWAFRIGNVDDIDRKMMHAAVEHLIRPGYQVADLLATIDCYYSWQCDRARFSFKPFRRWARYDSPVPWLYRACDENDYRRVLDAMRNQRVPLQSPATVRSLDVPDARARRREALPILFGTGLACRRIGREPPGNRPFRLQSGAGVSQGRDYFRAASRAGSSAEADVRSGLILQFFDVLQKLLFAG